MATDFQEELRRLHNLVLRLSTEIGGKNQNLEYVEKLLVEGSTFLSRMMEKRDHLNQQGSSSILVIDLREELRRLQNVVLRLSAEIGGRYQKLEYMEKMWEHGLTSLSRMTQEREQLNRAYKEEKIKLARTVYENERSMREFEAQRKEIEQQAKEIEKRDAKLDFISRQLLVLRKVNTVQGKREGVENMSSRDKVQLQIDTNVLHKELEETDYELDNELNQKQTLISEKEEAGHNSQAEKHNRIAVVEEEEPSNGILREVRNETPLYKETRSSTSNSIPVVSYCGEKWSKNTREEWNDLSTECLLNAFTDKKLKRGHLNLRERDWEEIAAIVTQHDRYGSKSVRQCKSMIDMLKRRFVAELGDMNRCSRLVSQWPWFEKMEHICTNLAPRKRKRLSTGGKNQKLEKKLDDSSTSLNRTNEERDHLDQAYNEEKRIMTRPMYESGSFIREFESQRNEMEQQAKEIEKHDSQLESISKQLLVLGKLNTVQGKCDEVENMSSQDKVQVQITTNSLHKELEEQDSKFNSELNRKQNLVNKEHRSNPDLQEACYVSVQKVTMEDDEKSVDLIDECGKGDNNEDSGGLEGNAFEDMFPPIPPPEYSADPCNDMPNNSSDLSSLLPVSDDEDSELESLAAFIEDSLLARNNSLEG